jgi:peptidoglycan/LPS O-acetylase OafA/YrhL
MSRSPATGIRYRSLDMWRGVACLMVVVFHSCFYADRSTTPWLGRLIGLGWLGVPIFFAISGFCVAAADSTRQRGIGAGTFSSA